MMNAPVIYGHPDTVEGFKYVVLAEQFRGSLADPLGNLGTKADTILRLMTGWIGQPLIALGAVGLGTSLARRPRYVILSGLSLVATCIFAASYANADISRYYLVPLMIVLTWAALGRPHRSGRLAGRSRPRVGLRWTRAAALRRPGRRTLSGRGACCG